ncbi:MAG: amino acid transporter [Candidatus Bathyarchaeota archaeon B26-1]|nr:MAG: amino acid transporter [Candidatus Bathyarchaeota archaeon B26-1]
MSESGLKRELGFLTATLFGVGGTLSAGNFVILGHAASLAGTSLVIIVFLCGIISMLTMLSYCELSTAIPKAGSEYTWSKVAFGGFFSFLTGWFQWTSNIFYASLSALGIAYMISYFFPLNIPLTAVSIILIFTLINIRGVKSAAIAETFVTLIVMVMLALYVADGWTYSLKLQGFELNAPNGLWGCFAATAFLFELYLGAEAIAVAQAEIKDPERVIPRAMILSSLILIVLYTSVVYVTLRVVPIEVLKEQTSPIAFAAELVMGKAGAMLISGVIIIAGLAAVNSAIMAQSRILYALSRDRYLPGVLSAIHGRFHSPHVASLFSLIFTVAVTLLGAVNFVTYLVNFGFVIGFAFVNLSLIKLRKKKPWMRRPFKSPLFPVVPLAGISISIILLLFLDKAALIVGGESIMFALLAYYLRMVGYSRLRLAVGGISLGTGVFTAFLAFMAETRLVMFDLPGLKAIPPAYILISVAFIQVLAGILNIVPTSPKSGHPKNGGEDNKV